MYSLANQRNATDPNLADRIQVLTLNNNNLITEIVNNDEDKKINAKINEKDLIDDDKEIIKIKKQKEICRICYGEEEDEKDDPLVQPCQCSGSLKYIHLKCLKHWINTRSCTKIQSNEYCTVFLFKEVECEICKNKLPDLINHNGIYHSLLDFENEYKDYLLLETLTLDECNNKFLYVISLEKSMEMKVGRGTSSSILLSDVSISRTHCLFIVKGKNVYIKDNNSKFGTLLLIQSPTIKMTENLPLFLQIGRTFLTLEISNKNFFSCCEVTENPNILYYYNQNEKYVKKNGIITVKTEKNIYEDDEGKKEKESLKKEKINRIETENDEKENSSIKIVIDNE